MMMIGSLLSDTELEPRMRMREPEPVVPPDVATATPAARPLMRLEKFGTAASSPRSGTSMTAGALPSSRRSCVSPVAVVTTPSRRAARWARAKSAVAAAPAATVTGCDAAA